MKLNERYTVKDIARFLSCEFVGNADTLITGMNEIHRVEEGDLVFVDHPKYYDRVLKSAATVILIDKAVECPEGKSLLISETPFDDYNKLAKRLSPFVVHKSMTGDDCQIADSAYLGPNAFIGNRVVIGENVVIHPGAYIGDDTILEDNVIVGPNTVIGHSAFYYKRTTNEQVRMHSIGYVHIEKDVEIGAQCAIDKGVSSVTRIGQGTKIDNQVQIGHDTVIGKNCLFAAQVGIAGCVNIEDNVIMWGQVGCASNVTIGAGAIVLAQSGISKDLEGNKTYFGSPCGEFKQKFRELAAIKRIPEILERL